MTKSKPMLDTYSLPRRYTALTAYQIDLWDSIYYLAAQGGGRFVVSGRELAALSGVPRAKLNSLLRVALQRGELRQQTPLDAPSAWHYELIVPGFHNETVVVCKPAGYVVNGWLKVVKPVYPKRLLNHLLALGQAQGKLLDPAAPQPLDLKSITHTLRRHYPDDARAQAPVALERAQEALDVLIRLNLLILCPDRPSQFQLDLSRFAQAAPLDETPDELNPRYRRARAQDPLRARRALDLVQANGLSFESDFEALFELLADLPARRLPLVRRALRQSRHLPPLQHWLRSAAALAQPVERQSIHRRTGQPTPTLWPHLRQRAWRHTRLTLAQLRRDKYQPDTFCSRPAAQAAYQRFCSGSRPGLLLVGPAGVGKSSLLARWTEGGLERGDLVLFNLAPTLAPDQLPRLLEPYLNLPAPPAPGQRLLLLIDALNEAADPPALLAALNRLLTDLADRPWAKLIISCRTLAWREMSRRDLLYLDLLHHHNGDSTVPLAPFDEDELADAYARCRAHYGLSGPLSDLTPLTQNLLRTPLLLGLAARTFQGQAIPNRLAGAQIFQPYLNQRLPSPAVQALLRRLAGRMAEQKQTTLPLTNLLDDPSLTPFFLPLGDAPYRRLVDENVLSEMDAPGGPIVAFTYERVLEYVIGQVALPPHLDAEAVIQTARSAGDWGPLWGAAVARLAQEVPLTLLEELARHPAGEVRGLVRDALIARHDQGDDAVQPCLERLARCPDPAAVHTGLAVALERRLSPPMLAAVAHPHPLAQEQGVLYSYYLWRRERERGWALLDELARQAVGRFGRPRRRPLTALLQTSLLIFLNHLPDTGADLRPLLDVWRDLLRRIPLVGGPSTGSGHRRSSLASHARTLLIAIGGHILDTLLQAAPVDAALPTASGKGYTTVAAFYNLSGPDKQFILQRLEALEPEQSNIQDPAVAQALLDLDAKEPLNLLFGNLARDALATHHLYQPQATTALIQRMLTSDDEVERQYAVAAAKTIAERGQFDNVEDLAISLNDQLTRWERERTETAYASFGFARTMLAEVRAGRPNPTLPQRLLQPAWARDDPAALVIVLHSLESLAYLGHPLPALRALRPHWDDSRVPVRATLVEILRRLAVLYPDDTLFFLRGAPADLCSALHADAPPVVLWGLLGRRAQDAWSLLFIIPPLRRFFLDLLRQTLRCPDWPAARRLIIERLIESLVE